MLANYREALKNPAVAHPHYCATRPPAAGARPRRHLVEWEDVDAEENLKILDNLPEEDEELTPRTSAPTT